MQTVTLDEAKIRFFDLVEAAAAGEEIYIQKSADVTLQLVPRVVKKRVRQFGSAKGLTAMADDFDEPLEDFKAYME